MSTPNNDNRNRASFGQQPSQPSEAYPMAQPPPKRRQVEEDESVGEAILEEIDDSLGISEKAFGCAKTLLFLPFRIVWKLIDWMTDLF
jgi:hypothetical protein